MAKSRSKFLSRLESLTIEVVWHDCQKIQNTLHNTYLDCYPEFLNYFRNLNSINHHNMVIGINFTYGWMPTAFDFRSVEFNKGVILLNKVKSGQYLSDNELQVLQALFNNSIVGTSKLLHFINPNLYAIWDSRVYRYIGKEEPHDYRVQNIEYFQKYQSKLRAFKTHSESELIRKYISQKVQSEVTTLRALEFVMYHFGELQRT